jgi:MFS transporter, DHA2 family, lincomycin resistance protein
VTNRSDLRMPDAAAAETRMGARDRTVIVVLLVSTFVVILNETIMVVALPVLMADLGVSPSVGQWLTAGFLLTMSVIIPITGFLIPRYSTKALFGAAMGLFSVGTLLAALAPGFPCCSLPGSCRRPGRRS